MNTAEKKSLSYKKVTQIKSILLNVLLVFLAFVMLTPLVWMLSTALVPSSIIPPAKLLPDTITFEN